MAEVLSGLCLCDQVKSGEDAYKMKFNPGRLVGAVIVAGVGFAGGFFY